MAHDRDGPDIVMTIRYAGASEIRAVTEHELNRTSDGSSAIDPARTHLNEVLHGPQTQQEAVQKMWADGVRKPTKQAEDPFVQIVLSASPEHFRDEGQGPGQWNEAKLKAWKDATMKWLRKEYGADLVHASLHLDEDTPHIHVLIVPTYSRKSRKPSRRKKSGETEAEFAERLAAWEADPGSTRTAGRSSSPYWSRMWCRLEARKSYHRALAKLGLGYGKDFVGVDEPSPEHKTTGKWVREQAAALADREAALDKREAELEQKRMVLAQELQQVAQERQVVSELLARLRGGLSSLLDFLKRPDVSTVEQMDAARLAKRVAPLVQDAKNVIDADQRVDEEMKTTSEQGVEDDDLSF